MRLTLSLSVFTVLALLSVPASASPENFLEDYRNFFSTALFNSRAQGIQAVDRFFATHYSPKADLRFTQKTTWAMPGAEPQTFDGTGKATPATWKSALGPQYNGEPLAFPAVGHIEKAKVENLGATGNTLKTKETVTAFYQLVPGMGGFRAKIVSICAYNFAMGKVNAQHCQADIQVTGAENPR